MRDLLEENGLPQPDCVEYGFTCIRLIFHETKTVIVIDIDEPFDDDVTELEEADPGGREHDGGRD